jgi:hypothetical protein
MLINFSNHPFSTWGDTQQSEAIQRWGSVQDLIFPLIDPKWDEIELQLFVKNYLEQIVDLKPSAVHIMGEMNFTFQLVYFLMQHGIPCFASTTERMMRMDGDQKVSQFKFVHFRKYQFVEQINEIQKVKENLLLTEKQNVVFEAFKEFIKPTNPNKVFILRGYAGTGKTTLLKFFYDYIVSSEQYRTVVAAPTNKAARVIRQKLNQKSEHGVISTMHGLLYSFDKVTATEEKAWLGGDGHIYSNFVLKSRTSSMNDLFSDLLKPKNSNQRSTIFMFDEASMISSQQRETFLITKFGTGSLLNDLYSCFGMNEKFIFVGDPCQLPPPNGERNPSALNGDYFKHVMQLPTEEYELTEVMRQSKDSGILDMATDLRMKIVSGRVEKWPKLKKKATALDIQLMKNSAELVETFLAHQDKYGVDNCFCLGYTNRSIQTFNKLIKERISGGLNLQVGDILINYLQNYLYGIENGERLIVKKIWDERVFKAKLTFVKVSCRVLGTNEDIECYLVENFLTSASSQMSAVETQNLMIDFDKRMREANIARNSFEYKTEQRKDPYLNALKAKYGYSGTIHKAQGSEWDYVFLNLGSSDFGMAQGSYENAEKIAKVIYTGLTRAKYKLFIPDGYWIKVK